MGRLTGKVALITGAAGGQGTAEAELFLREEAAVVLTDIDAAAGESLAQRLGGEGGKVLFLRQDVADEGSWKEVVAAVLARFGKLHILVNNAGTPSRANRRHRLLPHRQRGLRPCRARRDTLAPAGNAQGMRRSGAVPGLR